MNNFPTPRQIEELRQFHMPDCLTIYLPLAVPNTADNPNRIELKNMLAQARTALEKSDLEERHIRKTLLPVKLMLDEQEFWKMHHGGLALFAHPEKFLYFHLPTSDIPHSLTIQTGFDTAPLQEAMQENEKYYLLALGHKNVQLYEGDHFQLRPVNLKRFPGSMEASLRIDELPHSRQLHPIGPAGNGKGSEGYHDQSDTSSTEKEMLQEYFRDINRHLHTFLTLHHRPLVIAGASYLLPIYRKVNTYPGLVKRSVNGNQEHSDLRTLRQKAWQAIHEQAGRSNERATPILSM